MPDPSCFAADQGVGEIPLLERGRLDIEVRSKFRIPVQTLMVMPAVWPS